MTFIDLLTNGSPIDDLIEPLDDLNEPAATYDSEVSQYPSNCSNLEGTYNIEAPIEDQETQGASSSSKSVKHAQRSINFSHQEDRLLISAWLNTSLDPIKGSDQKKNQFWKRITRYFEEHKTWPDERTEKSLTNRWSKISFSVSKFSGHYAAIEHLRKSGYTEADKIQEAKTVYKDKEGHPFVLDHCWTILRFQQKWMGEHKKFEASRSTKACAVQNRFPINLEDDIANAPEPAGLKRPIGRKAAKEANKKPKSKGKGDGDEKESSQIRSELEEFRVRRLERECVKAEQLNSLIEIEQKQVALREKEIEQQVALKEKELEQQAALKEKELEQLALSEETKIMAMDTSVLTTLQAEYFLNRQREIVAKRANKNGSHLNLR